MYNNYSDDNHRRIEVVIENGRNKIKTIPDGMGEIKPLTSGTEKTTPRETFVVNEKELELILYIQSDHFLSGFPHPERVFDRIPVKWSGSLLRLFLKRARGGGLGMRFLRSYERCWQDHEESELPSFFRLSFEKLLRYFPKYEDYFLASAFGDEDFMRRIQAESFVARVESDPKTLLAPAASALVRLSDDKKKLVDEEGRRAFFEVHFRSEFRVRMEPYRLLAILADQSFIGAELTNEALDLHRDILKERLEARLADLLCLARRCPDLPRRIFIDPAKLRELLDHAERLYEWAKEFLEERGIK